MNLFLILGTLLLIVLVGVLIWALISFIAPMVKYILLFLVIVITVLLIIFILNNVFGLEIINGFLNLKNIQFIF